jgi:hypothetical protein
MANSLHLPDKPVKAMKSYSIKYKHQVINAINDLILHGHTVRTASNKLRLPHWYYKCWRKTVYNVDKMIALRIIVPYNVNGDSCKIHPGPSSHLDDIESNLSHAVFELREQGLQVNTWTVRKEASRLSHKFKGKTTMANISIVNRFINRVGLSHCASAHIAQKDHKETADESLHFFSLTLMMQKITGWMIS